MYIKKEILLSAKNVGLSYIDKDTKQEKVIIKDANFEIADIVGDTSPLGQVVSLVGKSGEGKSTLLRMLSGLYIPNSVRTGEILIHHDKVQGQHVLAPVKEGDMGIVFQDYYMPEHLTIRKMLMKSAKKNIDFKGDKKSMNDAIDWYVEQFELVEHQNKYPCQLSGGQKQRASIILQLINGSNFLLMDEPFSGLDPLMIDKTTKFLQKAANSDELKTLIIVSHDLVNCAAISDTIFVLSRKGRPEDSGATIVANIDLISMGLAYHDEIKRMPEFHNVIEQVKSIL
jgi:polar amino acid transport system ATP-binding protein/sulfate transport system ATP-binding protein/NitT/TauT family transport system ATP-binding protein